MAVTLGPQTYNCGGDRMKKYEIQRYCILIASICLIFLGLYRGEYKTVLKKAVNICLECIGIG